MMDPLLGFILFFFSCFLYFILKSFSFSLFGYRQRRHHISQSHTCHMTQWNDVEGFRDDDVNLKENI